MTASSDVLTAAADVGATAVLCVLGAEGSSPLWWVVAAGWALLSARQIDLTRRAALDRRRR